MIRSILETDIDTLLHWFNNPVALFLSSPKTAFPYTKSELSEDLLNKKDTFLLEEDGIIIGCISVNSDDEISHLFIKKEFRGKKHSKTLVNYLIDENKCKTVLIHKNQREHIKLFETMNFTDSSEVFEFSFESIKEHFKKYCLNE